MPTPAGKSGEGGAGAGAGSGGERMTATSSKFVQYVFAGVCWLTALALPAQATTSPGSFSLYLPACVLLWCGFYLLVSRLLSAAPGCSRGFAGYPEWSYFVGVLHGFVLLPIILGVGVWLYFQAHTELAVMDVGNMLAFLKLPWEYGLSAHIIMQQAHCAVIGYLLKDFFLYPDGLETAYLVHHIAAILGCALSLLYPSGAGVVTLNAVQCEFASALFSFSTVRPHFLTEAVYVVAMLASNVLATSLAVWVWTEVERIPYRWRLMYAGLSVVLIFLRCSGIGLFFFGKLSTTTSKPKAA